MIGSCGFLNPMLFFSPLQFGFRRGLSSVDALFRLETNIREGFVNREHTICVFFDLEKAYDTTWRYGILQDLHVLGLRGNLPLFVQNFLSSRSFQVRLGSMYSTPFIQQNGVPQGSVLSCTLFLVKIDAILNQLPPSVLGGLNVDDLHISCSSPRLSFIEHQLNRAILCLCSWADQNDFHFSSSKTGCALFPFTWVVSSTCPLFTRNPFFRSYF